MKFYIETIVVLMAVVFLFASPSSSRKADAWENRNENDILPKKYQGLTSKNVSNIICDDEVPPFRLPKNVIPKSYKITIDTHMEKNDFTFDGDVNIVIDILCESEFMTLHAKNLEIKDITLMSRKSRLLFKPMKYSIDNVTDFLLIEFKKSIPTGVYTLNLKYTGIINDRGTGFYRNAYQENNETMWIASTHFEPIGARLVFPCWDEPALKATFSIAIMHNKKYTAFSNMHVLRTKYNQDPTTVTTYFAKTPKMSTYIVAFVVANFQCRERSRYITIRICGKKDIINDNSKDIDLLMDASWNVVETMERFTDIPYNVSGFRKLDIIAIPTFAGNVAGMENWGLVTIREKNFLGKENFNRQVVHKLVGFDWTIQMIAHEIAHQWFGNLVTANWWSQLWINEGFASYLHYFIPNEINSKWRFMDRFVIDALQKLALQGDSPKITAPLITDVLVNNTDTLLTSTNTLVITYYKSASIIRMLSHVVGRENFHLILRNFLKNNAFKSVFSEDLIIEFKKVAGKKIYSLRKIINNWLTTPGYAVINVTRNYTTGVAKIVQSRFCINDNVNLTEKYWIPINYATEDNKNFDDTTVTHWLSPTDKSIQISGIKEDKWLIVNKQQFGYYRVNYDKRNWQLIIESLKTINHGGIHVLNRAQLIDDACHLLSIGQTDDISTFYSILDYLEHEIDPVPWIPAVRCLKWIFGADAKNKNDGNYQTYIKNLAKNMIRRLMYVEEASDNDYILRYYKKELLQYFCGLVPRVCRSAKKYSKSHNLLSFTDQGKYLSKNNTQYININSKTHKNLTSKNN